MNMIQFSNSISISESIFSNEYEYMYGSLKDKKVVFTYVNNITGKETEKKLRYKDAIYLAIDRAKDKRYKNFSYVITE